jgi:hypothetical protein
MNEKNKTDLFHTFLSSALKMKDTLGDMEKYAKSFRGDFKAELAELSDLDVIFIAGYLSGIQAALEGLLDELEELYKLDKHRKMFTVRDVGRA